jgi:hypothetical protein
MNRSDPNPHELSKRLREVKARMTQVITSGADGPDPKSKFYRHTGGWGFKGLAVGAALGGIGTVAYAASGQAERDSESFVRNAMDWTRHTSQGDTAMADLDAAMMALDILNMTGSSYLALGMWSAFSE